MPCGEGSQLAKYTNAIMESQSQMHCRESEPNAVFRDSLAMLSSKIKKVTGR